MSGFPVSIGTSLALESLFTPIQPVIDEARVVENIPDLSIYSIYSFNVSTLIRNLLATVPSTELITLSKTEIYECLMEEISFLTGFFQAANLRIEYYVHTYQYVNTTYSKSLRERTTAKQMFNEDTTKYCLDTIRKTNTVKVFHKDITYSKEDSVLMLSHVPFDLTSYSNFSKLDLLESHTGKVKTRKDWWSKYYPVPGCDMSILPFWEYLLSVFGDHVQFKPAGVKERQDLYSALKKKGVHPLMSEFSLEHLRL